MAQEIWFSEAKTKEDRERVKQDLALAHNAFKRLTKLLDAKMKDDTAFKDYEVANWAYLQADVNGYNRAVKEILKTIRTE